MPNQQSDKVEKAKKNSKGNSSESEIIELQNTVNYLSSQLGLLRQEVVNLSAESRRLHRINHELLAHILNQNTLFSNTGNNKNHNNEPGLN